MRTLFAIGFVICLATTGIAAQTTNSSLEASLDSLTTQWDVLALELEDYAALREYCRGPEYRQGVIDLLSGIHHYDSMLYQVLVKKSRFVKDREIKQVIKEIKKFETKYSASEFINYLHELCDFRSDIEHDRKNSKSDLGADSYDGQKNILETELVKYLKNVTKVVDRIREHSHHLHVDMYQN